jgi:transposase
MKKTVQAKRCKRIIPIFLKMIQALKQSSFKKLVTLGKTLYQWREEVIRMWRFSKNNGITEGFHRKMKLIQRRAYGFRNFENYRLRVSVLCS